MIRRVQTVWWYFIRQVNARFQLAFCLATHLRWLALTLVQLTLYTQGDASLSLFDHPRQVNSTQVDRTSTVHAWNLFATCVNLRVDLRIQFGHPRKSVRTVLVDLCRLASPFGQGFKAGSHVRRKHKHTREHKHKKKKKYVWTGATQAQA